MAGRINIEGLIDDLANAEAYLARVRRALKGALARKIDFDDPASLPWQELAIPVRAQNCIRNEIGLDATIGDVAQKTERDWLRVPNSGRQTVNAIITALAEYGMKLKGHRA